MGQKFNHPVTYLILGGLLYRTLVALWLPAGFDEAYYYVYSQHLDWSYFDHPALVALTTGFGTWITGEVTPFTLRWGALLLHTASLLLLYFTSARLFNPKAAQLTLAIATIIPIFQFAFGILTLPDCPLIFFWSASLYCATCEFFRGSYKSTPSLLSYKDTTKIPFSYNPSYRLAILGVLIGLACLGKYHGFVLGLTLVGFCLTSKRHRRALTSPWTFLGLALFIWTIFPLWFWNIQHDWISFGFQLSGRFEPPPGEIKPQGHGILGILATFLAGVGYLFPTMGLTLWWVSARTIFKLRNRASNWENSLLREKYWLILWVSLPLTVGFTLLGGKEPILPTWPMPGFWSLTLLLGERAVSWQQQCRRGVRRWFKGTAIILICLTIVAMAHMTIGAFQKPSNYALMGGFLPHQQDPSTELIDIPQLRRAFLESPELAEALENSSFIFTNTYYLSGYVTMALFPVTSMPITCFGNDIRGFAFWWQPETWLGEDGLYLTLERFHDIPGISADFSNYFQSFEVLTTIPLKRGGEVIETFYIYRAQNLLKTYPNLPKVDH